MALPSIQTIPQLISFILVMFAIPLLDLNVDLHVPQIPNADMEVLVLMDFVPIMRY